jgi:class 3 adenylate cyclase
MSIDLGHLSFTEMIQLQLKLGETLKARFGKQLCLTFTDVVGSTPYFARFGDAAGRGLQQRHLDLWSRALAETGGGEGRIVDTAGDGAFSVFPTVESAATALVAMGMSVSAQNVGYAREHQLIIRAGVHCGSVLTDGQAVSGDAVNVAARIAGTSQPGEIRLSEVAFRELNPQRRLQCHGVGMVPLKGVTEPLQLMVLEWRDKSRFASRVKVAESGEEIALPVLDTITFGRLRDQAGVPANDVVLQMRDKEKGLRVSRWHFELRRRPDGFSIRSVTDQTTDVDGKALGRGQETELSPTAKVTLAGVMTLEFQPELAKATELDSAPTGYIK